MVLGPMGRAAVVQRYKSLTSKHACAASLIAFTHSHSHSGCCSAHQQRCKGHALSGR